MEQGSIESILSWFPFSYDEKQSLRQLMATKDPRIMYHLQDFIRTRDIKSLESNLRSLFTSSRQTYADPTIKPNVSQYQQSYENKPIHEQYKPPTSTYQNYQYSSSTIQNQPQGTSYQPQVQQQIQYQGIGIQQTLPASDQRVENAKQAAIKGSQRNSLSQSQKREFFDQDELNKKKVTKFEFKNVESVNLEKLLSEYDPQKGFCVEVKEKIKKFARTMEFHDFCELKYYLQLDQINVMKFARRVKTAINEKYPPDQVNSKRYNPGLSLQEWTDIIGGHSLHPERLFHAILAFYYLDFNENGLLEMDELIQGFILMTSANKEDKIEAAFILCDRDENGILDFDELTLYLRATVRTSKGRKIHGISKDESSTAAIENEISLMCKSLTYQIFKEIDVDQNGEISLDEFRIWHRKTQDERKGILTPKDEINYMEMIQKAKYNKEKAQQQKVSILDRKNVAEFEQNLKKVEGESENLREKLVKIRKDAQLENCNMSHVLQCFRDLKSSEALCNTDFVNLMKQLFKLGGVRNINDKQTQKVINEVYLIFDTNNDGVISWDELIAGLSILIPGTEKEKINAVFNIFDKNQDNGLQFKELFFLLKSTFKTILNKKIGYQIVKHFEENMNPEELAFITAKKCFEQSNIDIDKGVLDFQTYYRWYSQNM